MSLKKLGKFLLLTLFFFLSFSPKVKAGLKDKYTERVGENEYVLHIFEQELKASRTNKLVKKIKYDYTYTKSNDSVVMLSTIKVPTESGTPESLEWKFCGRSILTKPELIYVSPYKDRLEYRLRITVSFKDWEEIISCDAPYQITYKFIDPHSSVYNFEFSYDRSKWNKVKKELSQIKNIIQISTRKP